MAKMSELDVDRLTIARIDVGAVDRRDVLAQALVRLRTNFRQAEADGFCDLTRLQCINLISEALRAGGRPDLAKASN